MKSIIKKLKSVMSPKCREELLAERQMKEARAAEEAFKARVAAANKKNEELLKIIVDNCSDGNLIQIKFPCGNWTWDMLNEEIPNLIEEVTESGHWAYVHGGGLIVIDPDTYSRNPSRIAMAIWEPSRFLEGEVISSWRYLERKK